MTELGVSKTELANRLNIKPPSIYDILKSDMRISTLEKIAEALQVPITRFFDSEPDDPDLQQRVEELEKKLEALTTNNSEGFVD